jgi:predicted KAP-like P-loop ATPase
MLKKVLKKCKGRMKMSKKTMLEKVELFRQLVSEISISRYEQKEFAEIVKAISLEIFTRSDIETLRNLEADDD